MVLVRAATLSLLLAVASAAPAIVWNSLENPSLGSAVVHTSDEIKAADLLSELQTASSGKLSVVFLLGRSENGSESLSIAAPHLHKVAEKYESASFIHYHVSGLQNGPRFVSEAVMRLPGDAPVLVNLQELAVKLNETSDTEAIVEMEPSGGIMSKRTFQQSKRERILSSATVWVVDVASDTSPDILDAAVVHAIEHSNVGTVVLSAVRSINEVKQERSMEAQRRWLAAHQASTGHRRLDDANAAAASDQDMSVYYVAMTPNILAGLLFFGLFVVVTWVGVSCMGMIAGQDVYVSKMPSIGREA